MNSRRRIFLITALTLVTSTAIVSLLLRRPEEPSVEPAEDATQRPANELLERLRALPYVQSRDLEAGEPAIEGVILHDRKAASPGLNIFFVDGERMAYLIDMDGRVVHSWNHEGKNWHHVEMDSRGNLFIVAEDALVKLDWDSQMRWSTPGRFHHDLAIGADGMLYAIARSPRWVTFQKSRIPVLDDYVVILESDGTPRDSLSLWDLLGETVKPDRLERVRKYFKIEDVENGLVGNLCDVFHLNSIEQIHQEVEGVCRPGDLLISVRETNTIAVLRVDPPSVVWSWGPGVLARQHQPMILANGNILVFDNGREFSRVLEVAPRTGRIVLTYQGATPLDFYTFRQGGSQRLRNGNTLITESQRGRVFEVTPEGGIVWDYRTEITEERQRPKRRVIYRMARIEPPELDSLPLPAAVRRAA